MVDVSQLVSQMHETLSNIHSTISSLSVLDHESRLDDLEQRRAAALEALQSGFHLESDDLARKRQAQREALAEQRRREDEERESRRRQEDEALLAQVADEDRDRHGKLEADTREVEESTETMMGNVEEEAQRMLEEGKAKLAALEAKRRELNRLIDEQLQMPLPTAPSRRKPREQPLPEMVASSNPVDIFDKRNDNGDGDRDAIPADPTKEIETISTDKSEIEMAEPQPIAEPAPAATQVVVVPDNDAPYQENEKYLQDVTSHVVPGGFPSSALQSPASENMIITNVNEIVQSPHQIVDEVVPEKEVEPVTAPAEKAVEVLQNTLEQEEVVPELHQQEQEQERLPVDSEEVPHEEPVTAMTEVEEHDETTPPVTVQVFSELDKEVNQVHEEIHEEIHEEAHEEAHGEASENIHEVIHEDIHEGHEEVHDENGDTGHDDIHDDLPAVPLSEQLGESHTVADGTNNGSHEDHNPETGHVPQQEDEDKAHESTNEEQSPAIKSHDTPSHDDTVHDIATEEPSSPIVDANIPSISIHTTDMTEEYLREATLGREAQHDESSQEKPAEETVAEAIPIEETVEASTEVTPEQNNTPEAVEVNAETPMSSTAPVHTPEGVPIHQDAVDSLETVAHNVTEPHISGEAGEPFSIDTSTETTIHDISEGELPEVLPEIQQEETQEAHHEEVDETSISHNEPHNEPALAQQPETNTVLEEDSVEEVTSCQLDNHFEPTVFPDEAATTHLSASEDVGVNQHEETAPEPQTPTAPTPVEAPIEEPHVDLPHDSERGHDVEGHDEHEALVHEVHDIDTHNTGTDNVDNAAHDEVDHEISQDVASHNIVNDNKSTHDNGHDAVAGPEAEPLHEALLHKEAGSMHIAEEAGVVASPDDIPDHDTVVEHTDSLAWHYQEPYVAQDVYSYPYAVSQEYVDYGSSYYASAQQSLDPSPVFHEVHETPEVHEAVGEPVLDENMIFGGADDTFSHGHAHALSLDKELEDVASEGDEEDEVGSDLHDESHTITLNEVREMHQDAVPEPEHAATMHGQDDLFDDDSEESAGSVDSDTVAQEEHGRHEDELALEHEQEHLHESVPEPEPAHGTAAEFAHETTSQNHEDATAELHDEMSRELSHEVLHESEIPQTPTTVVGDIQPSDHEEEQVTQFATAPPENERPVTPDAATPLASQFKGLANSRHATRPEEQQIPVTPPRQTAFHSDEDLDEIDFMPRDVTNVPWQERAGSIDATPGSVRSQATLSTSASSSFGSPSPWSAAVVAAITPQTSSVNSASTAPQDDPFIRTSWSSTPDDGGDGLILGRGKPIGQLDYNYDGHVVQVGDPEKRSLALDTVQTPPRTSSNSRPSSVVATSSPSSLFQRMRSIFEPPNGGVAGGVSDSPVKPSTAGVNSALPAPRDPYPATSNTANRLVEGGFIRGVHPSDSLTQNDDDDEDDQINEKSSLLQESAIDIPLH